jgi:phenylacetate-CoA ligase
MHKALGYALYRSIDFFQGQSIARRLRFLESSELWDPSRLRRFQEEKLAKILAHAGTKIPFYVESFARTGPARRPRSPEILSDLPVLTKEDVLRHGDLLLDPAPDERGIWDVTSGSTGTPMRILRSRSANGWARANELRGLARYGIGIGDKQARVWGVPIGEKERRREAVKDLLLNRVRYSPFDLRDEMVAEKLRVMSQQRPAYLYGYPSAIHELAVYLLSHGTDSLGGWRPTAVVCTAEMLFPHQMDDIERAFGCPVAKEYGASELTVIAFTCTHGSLHSNDESIVIEYEPTDLVIDGEPAYRLVLTDLNNFSMPLIRYRIGDLARPGKHACSCGIGLRTLELVGGREVDVLRTPSGKRVHGSIFSYLGKSILVAGGVLRFRARQSRLDRVDVEIEKGPEFRRGCLDAMRIELRNRAGDDLEVVFTVVSEVAPEPSGKLRYFYSDLNER